MTDDDARRQPPHVGDELETLRGFLNFLRDTIEQKTAGLADEALRRRLEPSEMTLVGMLKHLAYVEDFWFIEVVAGQAASAPWDSVDWDADEDWDWHSALTEPGEQVRALWRASVERSDAVVDQRAGVGLAATSSLPNGDPVTLRWVLVHMIEEYARHCGHADLLREAIDGQTGE